MYRLAFVPLIVLLAAACVEDSDTVAAPRQIATPAPQSAPLVYVAEPGDYLAQIADKFDVPLAQLIELNAQIEDPALIEVGDEIVIEKASAAPEVIPSTATARFGGAGDPRAPVQTFGAPGSENRDAARDESRWPVTLELTSDQARLAAFGGAAFAVAFALFFAMRAITVAAYRGAPALQRAARRQVRRGDDAARVPAGNSGSGSQPAGEILHAAAGPVAMAAVLPAPPLAATGSPAPVGALARATSSRLVRWGRAAGRLPRYLAVSSAHAVRAALRAIAHGIRAIGVRARPYARSAARHSRIAARSAARRSRIAARVALAAIVRGARRGSVLLRRGARLAASRPRQAWAEYQERRRRMQFRREIEERGAVALLRVGLIDESERYFRGSLERSLREQWHGEGGICLLGLADIAAQRGDAAEALAYLDRADESFALAGDETYRAQVLAKRATLQSTAGNQTAQSRAMAAPRIGPGLSRALQQDPASRAGE